MAIKELKLAQQALDMVPYYNKINEIIDHINSKETDKSSLPDMNWFRPDVAKIKKHDNGFVYFECDKCGYNSTHDMTHKCEGVEQEPNKVELVPLDDWIDQAIEDIVKTYNRTMNEEYRSRIRKSIEKYLPEPKLTLKKFTEGAVGERLVKSGRISHEDGSAERYGVPTPKKNIDDMKEAHEEKRGKYQGLIGPLTSLRCELEKLGIQGLDITYMYRDIVPEEDRAVLPDRMIGFNMERVRRQSLCR